MSSQRKLTFTIYQSAMKAGDELRGTPLTLTWEEWCARYFTKHEIRPVRPCAKHAQQDAPVDDCKACSAAEKAAKDGKAIVLAEIPKGKRRADENVVQVHALSIDLEHHSDKSIDALLEKLKSFAWVCYTTHSHGTEPTARLRIVLPLKEPHDAALHKKEVWPRLQTFVEGMNDPKTSNPSRLNYLPAARRENEGDANDYFSYVNEGEWLSVEDLPEAATVVTRTVKTVSQYAVQAALAKLKIKLSKLPKNAVAKESITKLILGEEFAPPSQRHDFILNTTWFIADRWPDTPIEAVVDLFKPSLEKMDTDQTVEDVRSAFIGALSKVEEVEKELKQEQQASAEKAAFNYQLNGQEPYTDEDLRRIAEAQGWKPDGLPPRDWLKSRWIIQRDSTFYFLKADGYYSSGASYMEARPAAAHILARSPVVLNEPTKTDIRRKTIQELVEDYGTRAERIMSDLTVQKSVFDSELGILREAIAPWRNLEPAYDPVIESWLRALAGDELHFEKLMNWLACAPDCAKSLCALYLSGDSGGGKTLLAKGVARIWSESGTTSDIHKILGNYNEELKNCPVVLADEAVPRKYHGNPTSTILRALISDYTRTLNRKYRSPSDLVGHVRLILTANNEFLLSDSDEAPGANDREAVAERFLYIEVKKEAKDFLEAASKKFSIQDKWLNEDGIAKFVLYLNKTRPVEQEGRFWVMGTKSAMARRLATGGSDWAQWTCEWLVRYLMSPNQHDAKNNGLIRRGDGMLLVNTQAVIDGWNQYLKTKKDPSSHHIGQSLAAISDKKIQRRWEGQHIWYHRVLIENLIDWHAQHGIGDAETIRKAIQGPMTAPGAATKPAAKSTPVPAAAKSAAPKKNRFGSLPKRKSA